MERGTRSLDIELTRLGQIGRLAEIPRLEKCPGMLTNRARENRRIDPGETATVEKVVYRLGYLGAHLEAGALQRRTQPEVSVIEQKVDAVLFGLDRVLVGPGQQRECGDPEFVSAGARASSLTSPVTATNDSWLNEPCKSQIVSSI